MALDEMDIKVEAEDFYEQNKRLIKKLKAKEVRAILTKGGKHYTDWMHGKSTPVAPKVVKRYKNGKPVAWYHPGNLLRSFKKLQFKGTNKYRSIFIGPKILKRGKGEGVFDSKRKVDGWYGIFQDKFKPRDRNYIEEAWNATSGKVTNEIIRGLKNQLGV